jgi:hypothetical protein
MICYTTDMTRALGISEARLASIGVLLFSAAAISAITLSVAQTVSSDSCEDAYDQLRRPGTTAERDAAHERLQREECKEWLPLIGLVDKMISHPSDVPRPTPNLLHIR